MTSSQTYIKMRIIIVVIFSLTLLVSCKKMIEVDLPIDRTTSETVFSNTFTAVSAVTSMYGSLANSSFLGGGRTGIGAYLIADELTPLVPEVWPEYSNSLSFVFSPWGELYNPVIYRANAIIEKVSASNLLPEPIKNVLTGEAKFVRALAYFYLVNYYGDVPLVTSTDFTLNINIARTDKSLIYDQIVKDLIDAQNSLDDNYLDVDLFTNTSERVRPNKSAATALLARVYLYMGNWIKAEEEASKIINNTSTYDTVPLAEVFFKNSKEAIWQLQPNPTDMEGANTKDGRLLSINPYNGQPSFELSSFALSTFEEDDIRKNVWVTVQNGYTLPNKYKAGWFVADQLEYVMVLRLSEQYLIRAEARAQQNKVIGLASASEDLNLIRRRAGLSPVTSSNKAEILDMIFKERFVELFTEGGHRWMDLIRTDKLDGYMSMITPLKGGIWNSYKKLLPIPYSEFKTNLSLRGHQNPGYSEN